MRFLADMGVSPRVVTWLRSQGHDAVHVRDTGDIRLPDAQILERGLLEDRIILTFDLDFGEIVALTRGRPAPVILLRLHNPRTDHLLERLDAVLRELVEAPAPGTIVIVEELRFRVRTLPPLQRL